MVPWFALLLVSLTVFSISLPVAYAQNETYHLSGLGATIIVGRDASLRVTEIIQFSHDIGAFTSAFRDIAWNGFDNIFNITVADNNGTIVPFTQSFTNGNFHVQWTHPLENAPAKRTFVLNHTVTNALEQPTSTTNQLRWQAGSSWSA